MNRRFATPFSFTSSTLVTSVASTLAAVTLTLTAACSSSNGPSLDPNKTNCDDVCSAAAQCASADQQKCSDDCVSKASNDSSYASSVKACSDCTTTKSSCVDLLGCSDNCVAAVTE